jgi:tRNA G10  N-methylase Trm11
VNHPAKYSDGFIERIADILRKDVESIDPDEAYWILDPMAGVGGIFDLEALLPVCCFGVELEKEYVEECGNWFMEQGDARSLSFLDETFSAIVVSPAYGNRMSDKRLPSDESGQYKRITYANSLKRNLSKGNGAGVQWGEEYREIHRAAWKDTVRVLKSGGLFLLNCKNHIRNKKEVDVCGWHVSALTDLGLTLIEEINMSAKGMRMGANRESRIDHEKLFVFKKP